MKASRSVVALVLAGGVLVAVAIAVPYFPRGTDLYVHVLWPWQVMKCLHAGSLPVWLPDLNAEFGSPGIGLYSPLGPTISGMLGLILGTGGRGVRAVLAIAALAIVARAPGRSRRERLITAALVLFAPAVLTEFIGRFPVAQLIAIPVAWPLLERAAARRWRWHWDGFLFALLWLIHAPTTVMVGIVSALGFVFGDRIHGNELDEDASGENGSLTAAATQFGLVGLVALALTAWHWWPLLMSAGEFSLRSALTGGESHPLRNLIGVADPHLVEINIAMGWAAIGLLAGLAVSGAWKSGRGRLAIVTILLAGPMSAPLWRYLGPLAWLQFPWRWMFPATLLATAAVVGCVNGKSRIRVAVSILALVVPILGLPPLQVVPDPALRVDTAPVEAGERVLRSFSGNPLLIDVIEHRPLWWNEFGETMALMGSDRVVLATEGGATQIAEWHPLRRRFKVQSPRPTALVVRLLADRHWKVVVNGRVATANRWGAALAVSVPAGSSDVAILWETDGYAIAGGIVSLGVLVGMVLIWWRRRLIPRP
jgi:hypothetical protein